MSVLTVSAARPVPREGSRARHFRVELTRDWQEAAVRWSGADTAALFQNTRWFDAWYGAFAGAEEAEPVIASVFDAASGEPAALLPLIRRRQNGLRIVEFADLDLTDYNGPILGAAAPGDAATARRMWRSVRAALRRLPDGVDLVRLRKMPTELEGRPNPLALLKGRGPCALNGNVVVTGEDYDAWRHTLERTVRKELERSWRVFTRDPAAGFALITDKDKALQILAIMEGQQRTRMEQIGQRFLLNDARNAAFYRSLVRDGVDDGYVVMGALTVGEEIVAALFGVRSDTTYVMIRISNAGDRWSNCSPGRLVIERTMAALHQDGVRSFDFSVGNYAYKRRFGVARLPLVDATDAIGWRGWRHALRDRLVFALRRHPQLAARVRRAIGRPPSREEQPG